MKKDHVLIANQIFDEYYGYTKLIGYDIDSIKILRALARDMSLYLVNTTLNSHTNKEDLIFWAKVKNELTNMK